jgi:site-specific DNA-methyltransferase (adenine-specific)
MLWHNLELPAAYYKDDWTYIINADCRDVLPSIPQVECIITDPIWPGASIKFKGSDDPEGLFADMIKVMPQCERLVVELGCDTDPRFLSLIPRSLPFLRVCDLKYQIPCYKGRILITGDKAYAFGVPPTWRQDRQLIGGECISIHQDPIFIRHTGKHKRRCMDHNPEENFPHPTPRRPDHQDWLIKTFCDEIVLDPFAGSCTLGVSAKKLNRLFIGIEIEERFCEFSARRMSQNVFDLRKAAGV